MPKTPARKQTAGGATANQQRSVVIHVFDEYRKSTKDFLCQRDLLLAKMKYFQAYLNETNEHDEIDISVHCDVEIFELLVEYMQQRETEWRPRITLENIASILVSSEFLQMDDLVEECIRFILGRVQEFLLLRVDFGCLSDSTIAKIASNCSPEQLQKLQDPKDKILSKLRRKKVEALVKTIQAGGTHRVELCEHCEMLFISNDTNALGCRKGMRQVGVHGELVGRHEAKAGWHVDSFLRDLAADKGTSWSAVYWYIWGSTNSFYCSVCRQKCSVLELRECAYHPGTMVELGPSAKYSCCSARIFSADDFSVRGCKTKAHWPVEDEKHTDISSFRDIVELPNMWEQIRGCERVARALMPSSVGSTPGGGRVDTASLFPHSRSSAGSAGSAEHDVWSKKHHSAGSSTVESNSSGARRQWKTMHLQEKDRVRCQELSRRLVQQRQNLTS